MERSEPAYGEAHGAEVEEQTTFYYEIVYRCLYGFGRYAQELQPGERPRHDRLFPRRQDPEGKCERQRRKYLLCAGRRYGGNWHEPRHLFGHDHSFQRSETPKHFFPG